MRRLLGPLHVTGVFWNWLPTLAPRFLPGWAFVAVETGFALAFCFFLHNTRRAIIANLAVALGPASYWRSQLRALRTMHQFALGYGERHEHNVYPERFRVRLENGEHWRRLFEQSRRTILVTAHIDAWDMLSHAAPGTLSWDSS